MHDLWEEVGTTGQIAFMFDGPKTFAVRNLLTGHIREVFVGKEQTVKDAIERDQFTDRDLSHLQPT